MGCSENLAARQSSELFFLPRDSLDDAHFPSASVYPRSLARRPDSKVGLLGQVVTPDEIAAQMSRIMLNSRTDAAVSILDPCAGVGSFPRALLKSGLLGPCDHLLTIDLDQDLMTELRDLKSTMKTQMSVVCGDYIEMPLDSTFDYAIMNPPYVRQEWLDQKQRYIQIFKERYGWSVPGTANSYVYFVAKVIKDLKPGGRCVCIVYDSWQSTKYGHWLLDIIQRECRSFNVVRVANQHFDGRLIDTTILDFTKRTQADEPSKLVICPSSSRLPAELLVCDGFATVDDLLHTRRGLRLKQADFFMCDLSGVKSHGATSFVKKVSTITGFRVPDDHPEAALIATGKCADRRLVRELQRRLQSALHDSKDNISVLNWYRQYPDTWFVHTRPPYAPIIFNYYIRNRPRHIYNASRAFSDNFYGLIPRHPIDIMCVLAVMNSTLTRLSIMAEARNQGAGLAKIQLYEYRRVRIPDWRLFDVSTTRTLSCLGRILSASNDPRHVEETLSKIDKAILSVLPQEIPDLESLRHAVDGIKCS